MTPDGELLRRYAEEKSEDAFAELLRRHLDFVYSAGLRQVGGDIHLAQDVAQSVFCDLARKSGQLAQRADLTGWLYTSAHFAAAKTARSESRRRARELEAMAMRELSGGSTTEPDWECLRPILDDALHELKEADREAILLRFFKNRPFADIGAGLGLNENAARMRIERAMEKLRTILARRGVKTSAGALALVLSTNAIQAAPVGLAGAIAGAAGTATLSATAAVAAKTLIMTTLQKTAVAVVIAGAVGTAIYEARQAAQLNRQVQSLQLRLVAATNLAMPTQTAASKSDETAAVAGVPARATTAIDWPAQLRRLNGGDWRQAFGLGQELAALPPETGLAILRDNWSSVTHVDARQQLLKAFSFARHDRLPAVLELGLLDASPAVQSWALSYLKEVALQDFSTDYNGAVAWLAAKRELKLEAAFNDALWNLAHTLRDADPQTALQKLELLRDASQLLAKYPQMVAASGMNQTFTELVNGADPKLAAEALKAARNMAFGDDWLRNVAGPRLGGDNPPSVREAAATAIAGPGRDWAVAPVLDALELSVRSGNRSFGLPSSLATIGSPKAIPTMIALIDLDNTYDTVYGIGYFGLNKLTGVNYDEKHDGAWWRQWWENNKQRFPADVQALPIPQLAPLQRAQDAAK